MNLQIRKENQTKITAYTLELECECGGKMYWKSQHHDGYKHSLVVECDKCHKTSCVELKFNNYKNLDSEV